MAEEIVDSPSTDPFAAIDWMTMTSTKQLSLIKALRAIETAKDDDRIKGIYLRLNGGGGVSGSAIELTSCCICSRLASDILVRI